MYYEIRYYIAHLQPYTFYLATINNNIVENEVTSLVGTTLGS
jgi:hypothetical protein